MKTGWTPGDIQKIRVRSISSLMNNNKQNNVNNKQNIKLSNNKNMISISIWSFTIKNHPSVTMENKNENKKRFG